VIFTLAEVSTKSISASFMEIADLEKRGLQFTSNRNGNLATYHVKKGFDIPLAGVAPYELHSIEKSSVIAVSPNDLIGFKYKLNVREGDSVLAGTALCQAKHDENIILVSPVAGVIKAILRGERRTLEKILIQVSDSQEAIDFGSWNKEKIKSATPSELIHQLQKGGFWPLIRQRPFDIVADWNQKPKAIFVNGMDSSPLAPSIEFLIKGQEDAFQAGLNALSKLAPKTHLCIESESKAAVLCNASGVEIHTFSGKHPRGLVGTHIYHIDPINKGDVVWYLSAQDVCLIGSFLTSGKVPSKIKVCVAGTEVQKAGYYEVLRGTKLSDFIQTNANARVIEGNVLSGRKKNLDDYLGFYAQSICAIPEGDQQYYLLEDRHWASIGVNRFTLWRVFLSKFIKFRFWKLDTNQYGEHRAIVFPEIYDQFVAQDIMVNYLSKAILTGDISEMEKLGLYELSPEDVALCTFACPSKVDFSKIVAEGLELLRKEG
jgi:Na+-transporting NADH:ubiquinone oxidoreductase subunit A